jgi:hypothetical protein
VALDSEVQFQKHLPQRRGKEDGMQIDGSDLQYRNAESSIHESLEPASNARRESQRLREKQSGQSRSTVEGIHIQVTQVDAVYLETPDFIS